jgi:hypothetical protein
VGAARIVSFWEMPPKHALALCKQKILRFWGLTVQRVWARLILDRFRDLVLSPGDPTAKTAGFGWKGGRSAKAPISAFGFHQLC